MSDIKKDERTEKLEIALEYFSESSDLGEEILLEQIVHAMTLLEVSRSYPIDKAEEICGMIDDMIKDLEHVKIQETGSGLDRIAA